jgi:hypothetical protein
MSRKRSAFQFLQESTKDSTIPITNNNILSTPVHKKDPLADIITNMGSNESKGAEFESRRRKPFGSVDTQFNSKPIDTSFKNVLSTPVNQNMKHGLNSYSSNPNFGGFNNNGSNIGNTGGNNLGVGGSRRQNMNKNLF